MPEYSSQHNINSRKYRCQKFVSRNFFNFILWRAFDFWNEKILASSRPIPSFSITVAEYAVAGNALMGLGTVGCRSVSCVGQFKPLVRVGDSA